MEQFIEVKVYYHKESIKEIYKENIKEIHNGTKNVLINITKVISLNINENHAGKKYYILTLPALILHLPLSEGRRIWKKLKNIK